MNCSPFYLLVIVFITICSFNVSAQTTEENAVSDDPKTEDVIYMKDGRVLRGEIIIFQETDGDITFVDREGRKYSITRDAYDYFIENEPFKKRGKSTKPILPRKENEIEFTFGLSLPIGIIDGKFNEDVRVDYGQDYWAIHPVVNLRTGVGKYFNRKNYLGVRLDYGLLGEDLDLALSPAVRFKHNFDGNKRNIAWYILLEMQYNYMKGEYRALVPDQWTPGNHTVELVNQKQQNFGVNFGQGVAFILANKSSIGFEFSIFRNNVFDFEFTNADSNNILYESLNHTGVSFSLIYNL